MLEEESSQWRKLKGELFFKGIFFLIMKFMFYIYIYILIRLHWMQRKVKNPRTKIRQKMAESQSRAFWNIVSPQERSKIPFGIQTRENYKNFLLETTEKGFVKLINDLGRELKKQERKSGVKPDVSFFIFCLPIMAHQLQDLNENVLFELDVRLAMQFLTRDFYNDPRECQCDVAFRNQKEKAKWQRERIKWLAEEAERKRLRPTPPPEQMWMRCRSGEWDLVPDYSHDREEDLSEPFFLIQYMYGKQMGSPSSSCQAEMGSDSEEIAEGKQKEVISEVEMGSAEEKGKQKKVTPEVEMGEDTQFIPIVESPTVIENLDWLEDVEEILETL